MAELMAQARWRALTGFLVAVLALTGCGADTQEVALTAPGTLAFVEDPHERLSAEESTWATFEARHRCHTQRTTFPTDDGVQLALEEALERNGLERGDYEAFMDRLGTEQLLRDAVRFSHQQFCMG